MTRFYDTPFGQIDQFLRNFAKDMTAEEVAAVNKHPELTLVMLRALRDARTPKNRFDRYYDLLMSPIDWIARLRYYNRRYWNNFLTEKNFAEAKAQLAAIPIGHVQSVDNLIGFHVDFGSPYETFNMWYTVFKGELPDAVQWQSGEIELGHNQFRLHKLAQKYSPGIHLVNINLVAYWEPKTGITLEGVRRRAALEGAMLAQFEVFSIYGVLKDLFMKQDGDNLPFSVAN